MSKRTRAKSAARTAHRKARARRRSVSPAAPPTRATEAALAAFAHDLRTPLTGILALSELLATSELGERELRWIATLKSNAEHLSALTTLIVDAAKAQTKGLVLRCEPFEFQRFVQAVADTLAARAESKGLATRFAMPDDLPERVTGDPVRLRAALENLIDNAVKFTDRGEVSFAVTAARGPRHRLRVVFTITDSGIGMTAAEIKQLFRPFTQASAEIARRYGGAGLGLSMVKQLTKAMGGNLEIESRPGHGSTLRLTVLLDDAPPADAASGPAGTRDAQAAPGGGRRLRILCAEDNPYGRVVMNAILTELGHRTDFVGSGESAIEAVKRGGYDVVLMDVMLSGIDGVEATRRIRALPGAVAQTPIVGISGRASDELPARGAGMEAYLVKPVSPRILSETLQALTGKA
jgi:CheY-like chemotaxis protein/nitrogen-specific signal transduction histidine kinase